MIKNFPGWLQERQRQQVLSGHKNIDGIDLSHLYPGLTGGSLHGWASVIGSKEG